MSDSKRKAIIKDRPRNAKKSTLYWRKIRRVTKQLVGIGEEDLPNPKSIINDYDYCDYIIDNEYVGWSSFFKDDDRDKEREKYRRK